MTATPEEVVHEKTADGRDRHLFQKRHGDWLCECGERRDAHGSALADLFSLRK